MEEEIKIDDDQITTNSTDGNPEDVRPNDDTPFITTDETVEITVDLSDGNPYDEVVDLGKLFLENPEGVADYDVWVELPDGTWVQWAENVNPLEPTLFPKLPALSVKIIVNKDPDAPFMSFDESIFACWEESEYILCICIVPKYTVIKMIGISFINTHNIHMPDCIYMSPADFLDIFDIYEWVLPMNYFSSSAYFVLYN